MIQLFKSRSKARQDFCGVNKRVIIESYSKRGYQILRVEQDDDAVSDLSELEDLISGCLSRGKIHVAVSFLNASYIYSGALKVLISCLKRITAQGGTLSIIEPNPKLLNILNTLTINRVIKIYVSEDYLPEIE